MVDWSSDESDSSDDEMLEYKVTNWRIRGRGLLRSRRFKLLVIVVVFAIGFLLRMMFFDADGLGGVTELSDEELMSQKGVETVKDLKFSSRNLASKVDAPFQIGCREIDSSGPRANAAFVVLAMNSEIDQVVKSMNSMERHFNQWFNYPWVFLNDEPFDESFKQTVKQYTQSEVEFGTISPEDWNFGNVDPEEFKQYIESQGDRRIYYGNKAGYHKMCRYFSGAFYKHELVKKRDWYWRVEPNVEFFCDITYDPFIEMEKHGKKYGFAIVIHELYRTVPSLFRETKAFTKEHNIKPTKLWRMLVKNFKYSSGTNEDDYDMIKEREHIFNRIEEDLTIEKFLSIKDKTDLSAIDPSLIGKLAARARDPPLLHEDRFDYEEYNLCHFWSNFEIAQTSLFTSELYQKYYDRLERSGGFYKERWGDAPIHSLAIAMMLDIKEIHYFRDIGYKHSTLGHCPANSKVNQLPYAPSAANVNNANFQLYKPNRPRTNGVGCRCRCPMFHREIEDSGSLCMNQWVRTTRDDYVPYKPIDLDYARYKIGKRLDRFLKRGGRLGDSNIGAEMAEARGFNP